MFEETAHVIFIAPMLLDVPSPMGLLLLCIMIVYGVIENQTVESL